VDIPDLVLSRNQERVVKRTATVVMTRSRDVGSADHRPTFTYHVYFYEDGTWHQQRGLSGVKRDVERSYRGWTAAVELG